MRSSSPDRDQCIDIETYELFRRVPEEAVRSPVCQYDPALNVHDEDTVRTAVHHRRKQGRVPFEVDTARSTHAATASNKHTASHRFGRRGS